MKVLSLFDGISCARVALERSAWIVESYHASEVDKYAIQISNKNYPDILHLGSVMDINPLPQYDLLIGGSPCQDLSIAKKNRKGLAGDKSGLFWEYVRILRITKPKFFILENVASMSQEAKDQISNELGIQPVMIDAALVSAQQRKRLFWVGERKSDGTYSQVHIEQPKDRGILLKDILVGGMAEREKSLVITATYSSACPRDYFTRSSRQLIKVGHFNKGGQGDRVYSIDGKSCTLSACGAKTGLYETTQGIYRKLHPIECERLQGLPDGYTEGISNTQRYKCLGNAFNVDVITHILNQLDIDPLI